MGAISDARATDLPDRIRVLRDLGAPFGQDVSVCAALEKAAEGRPRLVVVERVLRGAGVDEQDIAGWLRHARLLASLEHPNVARVREVIESPSEAMVVTDFVDGARWSDFAPGPGLPLEIALRVLLDILAGLGAVHNMRDAARQPLKLVHGAVTADAVLIGLDGVARVAGASRLRAPAERSSVGSHYLAPEVLLEDDTADARADVYSVGVLLWEALSRRPLFMDSQASAIVTAVLSGRVPRAEVPAGASWAAPLVDVAARALSAAPDKRYATAAAMAADLRRVGGMKLVPSIRVAAAVRTAFGERIKTRREELERGEAHPRAFSGTAAIAPAMSEEESRASSAPTPVPPAPTATTRPPPPLPSAPVPAQADASSSARSDSARSVESISIPVAVSTSSPPDLDGHVTDPVPVAAVAVERIIAESRPELLAAPPVPRELRNPPAPAPGALTLEPSVFASAAATPAAVRKDRIIKLAALPVLVLVLVGVAVWLGSGEAPKANVAASASGERRAPSLPASARAAEVATPTPTPTATPTPTLAGTRTDTATAAATATESPPAAASAPPPPPEPPRKPRPTIKYDPQGI